jgi:hypothetical protein
MMPVGSESKLQNRPKNEELGAMLPPHIIEELLKREREKKRREELHVDPPVPEPLPEDDEEPDPIEDDGDRGVAIIDFSV